jgi:aryl-alcohol dehydrogenase-like predicted oxidoreductase
MFERQKIEAEFVPLYRKWGLGTTVWSPLASGVLTGKYDDGIPADSRLNVKGFEWLRARYDTPEGRSKIERTRKLEPIARELGVTRAQLALAWCLKNPDVSTVILGASKKSQITENLKSLEVAPRLTPEQMARIEEVLGNRPEQAEDFTA